jgi:hypothetical protein
MYTSAADYPTSCLVGVHSGTTSNEEDFHASWLAFDTMNRRGIAPLAVALLVVDPGDHTPGSKWRQKFAQTRKISRPHRIAFINNSAIARGVITAIDWLQPPTSQQQVKAWATLEEGIAWLEGERRESLHILRHLYEAAREAGLPAPAESVRALKLRA